MTDGRKEGERVGRSAGLCKGPLPQAAAVA